ATLKPKNLKPRPKIMKTKISPIPALGHSIPSVPFDTSVLFPSQPAVQPPVSFPVIEPRTVRMIVVYATPPASASPASHCHPNFTLQKNQHISSRYYVRCLTTPCYPKTKKLETSPKNHENENLANPGPEPQHPLCPIRPLCPISLPVGSPAARILSRH